MYISHAQVGRLAVTSSMLTCGVSAGGFSFFLLFLFLFP
jgi:hypothetical protein